MEMQLDPPRGGFNLRDMMSAVPAPDRRSRAANMPFGTNHASTLTPSFRMSTRTRMAATQSIQQRKDTFNNFWQFVATFHMATRTIATNQRRKGFKTDILKALPIIPVQRLKMKIRDEEMKITYSADVSFNLHGAIRSLQEVKDLLTACTAQLKMEDFDSGGFEESVTDAIYDLTVRVDNLESAVNEAARAERSGRRPSIQPTRTRKKTRAQKEDSVLASLTSGMGRLGVEEDAEMEVGMKDDSKDAEMVDEAHDMPNAAMQRTLDNVERESGSQHIEMESERGFGSWMDMVYIPEIDRQQ